MATIPVGDGPGWAETADDGRVCLIANTRSHDLSLISIPERREIRRLPMGNGPKHITVARLPMSVIAAVRALQSLIGPIRRRAGLWQRHLAHARRASSSKDPIALQAVKARAKGVLPTLLVVFDGGRVVGHVEPYNIRVAMYGLEQIHIAVPPLGTGSPHATTHLSARSALWS
jgi:hypothetical protein